MFLAPFCLNKRISADLFLHGLSVWSYSKCKMLFGASVRVTGPTLPALFRSR
uniref:Uncharacterized protein n=1 Tax=Arundo donax TaxID=35708 RepID=A0A0A9FGG8_ARUDO